jgi:hypothetical protein
MRPGYRNIAQQMVQYRKTYIQRNRIRMLMPKYRKGKTLKPKVPGR